MTNSTKITDIPGASEAFNICDVCNGVGWYAQQVSYTEQEQRRCENCNGDQDGLHDIHLEVDVEAICKIVRENDIVYTDYTSMKDLNLVGEAIAESIPKWARLVRK